MPHHRSAMKRLRQDAKRRSRNRSAKTRVRRVSKRVRTLAGEGKPEEAMEALREASAVIDRAAQKKVLHRRTASRRKSRLARAVSKSGAKSDSPQG
jgi:small subunit ribosomal protein S20